MTRRSIHDYDRMIERTMTRLEASPMCASNKKAIADFDRFCVLSSIGAARRSKLLRHVVQLEEEFLRKPFGEVTKRDIQDVVARIEARKEWTLWTKHDTKVVLKKFFKWHIQGDEAQSLDEFPDLVSWIKPALKRKDLCRVRAADLLLPEEAERLIQVRMSSRDRAILALLYELGARVGEIGGLNIGDVWRDEYSLLIDLDGKTGPRTVRVVQFASHLVAWMNAHPQRDDPRAPLWPTFRGPRRLRHLNYAELRRIVLVARDEAGIKKRVYPHLFRHSRVTHLLAGGKLNEAQAKVFFGWVPDSKILSTYAHLVTKDANDAILRMYGVQQVDAKPTGLRCGMCEKVNPVGAALCFHCGYAVGAKEIDEARARTKASEAVLLRLLQKPETQSILMRMLDEERNNANTNSPSASSVVPSDAPTPQEVQRRRKAS